MTVASIASQSAYRAVALLEFLVRRSAELAAFMGDVLLMADSAKVRRTQRLKPLADCLAFASPTVLLLLRAGGSREDRIAEIDSRRVNGL